jgi:hypothetical protein
LLVSLANANAAGRRPTGGRPRSPNKPQQPTSRATPGARRRKRAGAARG